MQLMEFSATPIQKLGLSINGNSIFIKRDDLFPLSFGGNKARKAVLFFEDLILNNSDCVVTYGSSSSNHCRVIANIAAALDIPCHIISPIESSYPTSNSKLIKLFGAYVTNCPTSQVSLTIERKIEELKTLGYRPYFIQGGGHGNIGTHSYVKAYKEILNYEKSSNIFFDYIFHTSGTGTTQAGLICGKILHGDKREIIGISNARKNAYGSQVVLESVNSYLSSKNKEPILSNAITFIDDYVIEGYGSYNNQVLQTIRDILIKEGIPMDTTYCGKAFWGMKEYIKNKHIINKKILFIHTGGTPLFFDKLEDIKNER